MKSLLFLLPVLMIANASLAAPVRHVVQFKFKKDATPEQVQRVVAEFALLKKKIKEIDSLEWGTNVSPEGLNKGFTHCWILTFKSEADRDTYLHHRDHEAFVAIAKPLIEDVQVIDFVPAKAAFVPADKVKKPMRSGIPKAWGAQKTG
jgi:hypothetical protein